MREVALQLWNRLPALIRGAVSALLILFIGQMPPSIFLALGLRFTPAIPWWVPATAVWLWLFWRILSGRWPRTAGSAARRDHLRGHALPVRVWLGSLLGGALGMVSVLCLALLTGLVADLPKEAYKAPLDLSPYAWWTILAFFLNIAATAGVVEEAAFRGYMLSIIERRHGWLTAISCVAALFYLVHLGHAYATWSFVPFFTAYSLLHGALVFLTRSILPSVILHSVGDLTILPMQYGVLANPLGSSVPAHVIVIVVSALLSLFVLRWVRHETTRTPR